MTGEDLRYPAPFGPYELLGPLGQGPGASAHLACLRAGTGTSTPVVLKVLSAGPEPYDEFALRLRREAEIAVTVESPFVARVLEAGEVANQPYIVIEYVPGWTLGKMLGVSDARGRVVPVEVAAEIARQFLRGLSALHLAFEGGARSTAAVPRDVSPKNVIVGDDGRVRIVNMGLGRPQVPAWAPPSERIAGSPGYMAPEQISDQSVGKLTDVYAAGVVIHELFTSRRYIPVGSPDAMFRAALNKRYVSVREARSELPTLLDEALQAALEPDPGRRTSSVEDLMEGLLGVFGPGPDRPTAVSEWVRATLPAEQSARRAEVRRLLSTRRLQPREASEVRRKQGWVVRPGVGQHAVQIAGRAASRRERTWSDSRERTMGRIETVVGAPGRREKLRLLSAFILGGVAGSLVTGALLGGPPPPPRESMRSRRPPPPVELSRVELSRRAEALRAGGEPVLQQAVDELLSRLADADALFDRHRRRALLLKIEHDLLELEMARRLSPGHGVAPARN